MALWEHIKQSLSPAEVDEVASVIGHGIIDENAALQAEVSALESILSDLTTARDLAVASRLQRRPMSPPSSNADLSTSVTALLSAMSGAMGPSSPSPSSPPSLASSNSASPSPPAALSSLASQQISVNSIDSVLAPLRAAFSKERLSLLREIAALQAQASAEAGAPNNPLSETSSDHRPPSNPLSSDPPSRSVQGGHSKAPNPIACPAPTSISAPAASSKLRSRMAAQIKEGQFSEDLDSADLKFFE